MISPAISSAPAVDTWLYPVGSGIYCEPGDFYIDPGRMVDRAVITHGHSDHARAGHRSVLATAETIAIMKVRYGEDCAGAFQALRLGETISINGVGVRLVPAGAYSWVRAGRPRMGRPARGDLGRL